jgi:hypothetical protein
LIEEHGSKPDIGIAYFFFDFSDRQKQQSSQMLRSLVDQLCRQLHPGDIPADFKGGMAGAKETIPIEVLIKALHTISKKLSFTYIVLDALDESDRSPVLKDLNKLVNAQSGKLNILMTSRKERDMEEALSDLPALKSIDIQNSVVDLDIQLFVRETLRNETKFEKWSQEVRQEVEIELGKGAQGM